MSVATPGASILLTRAAAEKVNDLLQKEGLKGQKDLRVFVQGGGCAGLSYGMVFDEADADGGDLVTEASGVRIIIDAMSASYLSGTEIDYVDGLMGQGFTFSNPNAKGGCACGHSFSTETSEVHSGSCASGCGH
ncbi:MAG: iron-sulfur cluster insertion protein ErpA [Chloroflexota bacterium]|nr:iron-sulfur cluster insertion protein ErpA [Chloroflexota bacterium]